MTICIAALGDDGKSVALAADQMVTASIPFQYQYEAKDFNKICDVAENAAVLSAGNALFAAEIIRAASKKLTGAATIEQIAELVRNEYQVYRLNLRRWGWAAAAQSSAQEPVTNTDALSVDSRLHASVIADNRDFDAFGYLRHALSSLERLARLRRTHLINRRSSPGVTPSARQLHDRGELHIARPPVRCGRPEADSS